MRIIRSSFSLFLFAFWGQSLAAGTITPVKPTFSGHCYVIKSAAELYGFAAIVNGTDGMSKRPNVCGKLSADIVVNEGVLDKDGYLSSDSSDFVVWPSMQDFKGSFDGQGHTISGLYANDKNKHQALFGTIATDSNKVTIQNLGIVDSYFYGSYSTSFAGRVTGDSLYIENCYSTSTIYSDGTGGFVDYTSKGVHINNSYYYGRPINPTRRNRNSCFVGSNSKSSVTNSFCVDSLYAGYGGTSSPDEDFANGTIATILHNSANGSIWGQKVGLDKSPTFSGSVSGSTTLKTWDVTLVTFEGDTEDHSLQYVEGYGAALPQLNRDGYHFDGWYATQDYSGGVVIEISSESTGELTFYAKWSKYPKMIDNCYEISTAEELYGFSYLATNDFTDVHKPACGRLVADIVVNRDVLKEDGSLNGDGSSFKVWNPIVEFVGTFDGQNHFISGLYFNDSTKNYVGLFGTVNTLDNDSTIIKNVRVRNSYFKGISDVGGIVGHAGGNKVRIRNSYSNATVVATKKNAAGIAGYSDARGTVIAESFNSGHVSAPDNAAGLLGYYHHFTAVPNTLDILNSYNSGSIEGQYYVGGLVAYNIVNWVTVVNSYNTGNVTGKYNIGGIIAYNSNEQRNTSSTTLTNVYNTGDIKGESNVAGLVANNDRHLAVDSSFNKGKITGVRNVAGLLATTTADNIVGNLVNVSIGNSFNEGTFQKDEGSRYNVVAGLIGNSESDVSIWNSYNNSGIDNEKGGCAGFVGKTAKNVQIVNSYNNGKLGCHADSTDAFVAILSDTATVTSAHSYYLETYPSQHGGEASAATEISDGTLVGKLSGYSDTAVSGSIWTQKIGTDDHPVLKLSPYVSSFVDSNDKEPPVVSRVRYEPRSIQIRAFDREIEITGAKQGTPYRIFDLKGNLVKQGRTHSGRIALLHAGVYIVKLAHGTHLVRIQ